METKTELTIGALKEIMNGNLGGAREMMNTQLKINELIEKCEKKAKEEFDDFKSFMLSLSNIDIFNEAYKILSYNGLLYYFTNNGFRNDIEKYFEYYSRNINDDMQKLTSFSDTNIINNLYQSHFDYDLNLWEDTDTLIEYVVFNKI